MTYSLAATGQRSDQQLGTSTLKVGDAAGLIGLQQGAMAQNTQILCKNPDGSESYYTIDAERSTPANIVMKAV